AEVFERGEEPVAGGLVIAESPADLRRRRMAATFTHHVLGLAIDDQGVVEEQQRFLGVALVQGGDGLSQDGFGLFGDQPALAEEGLGLGVGLLRLGVLFGQPMKLGEREELLGQEGLVLTEAQAGDAAEMLFELGLTGVGGAHDARQSSEGRGDPPGGWPRARPRRSSLPDSRTRRGEKNESFLVYSSKEKAKRRLALARWLQSVRSQRVQVGPMGAASTSCSIRGRP